MPFLPNSILLIIYILHKGRQTFHCNQRTSDILKRPIRKKVLRGQDNSTSKGLIETQRLNLIPKYFTRKSENMYGVHEII